METSTSSTLLWGIEFSLKIHETAAVPGSWKVTASGAVVSLSVFWVRCEFGLHPAGINC